MTLFGTILKTSDNTNVNIDFKIEVNNDGKDRTSNVTEESHSTDLLKEIKKNLDEDTLKEYFNFDYNFLNKDQSESELSNRTDTQSNRLNESRSNLNQINNIELK